MNEWKQKKKSSWNPKICEWQRGNKRKSQKERMVFWLINLWQQRPAAKLELKLEFSRYTHWSVFQKIVSPFLEESLDLYAKLVRGAKVI